MKKHHVLVGITSGIAAYKALDLIKLLKQEGVQIRTVLTSYARQMFDIKELEKLTENKVYVELFEKGFDYQKVLDDRSVEHINLADEADLMIIIPATANTIGKLAHGIADDYLTTTALAMTGPLLVCPAMNVNMWNNPAVQENISVLKKRGIEIIEPVEGMLACGYEGKGRLENIQTVFERIKSRLATTQSLKGKRVIVTAGGTIEPIDDVRHITNRSSGRMGAAIANECYLRGANVVLLRAKNSVAPRYLMTEEFFETPAELEKLMQKYVKESDICFHVAAVSDFRVAKTTTGKLSGDVPYDLQLENTHKIITRIKAWNPSIYLVGFKAVYDLAYNLMSEKAHAKLQETQANAIVVNDISRPNRGFQSDTNEVFVVIANEKIKKIPLAPKDQIAASILDTLKL